MERHHNMGSVNFSGSQDYITVPDDADFDLSNEDFTIEIDGSYAYGIPKDPFILKECIRDVLKRVSGIEPEVAPQPIFQEKAGWYHINIERKTN